MNSIVSGLISVAICVLYLAFGSFTNYLLSDTCDDFDWMNALIMFLWPIALSITVACILIFVLPYILAEKIKERFE